VNIVNFVNVLELTTAKQYNGYQASWEKLLVLFDVTLGSFNFPEDGFIFHRQSRRLDEGLRAERRSGGTKLEHYRATATRGLMWWSNSMLYAGWSCEQLLGEDVHGNSTRNDRDWFAGFGWRVW
jgi:hypothetical protein